MRRIKVIILTAILLCTGARVHAQSEVEKTRLLLVVDCSNTMWDHWQSAPKIKVTQQVLLSFLDSVAGKGEGVTGTTTEDVEVALRVFGHLNKDQIGTRLEVPFGADNTYRLQSKIKTLVPQGGCTVGAALTDALTDFPATEGARNLILIITDGIESRDDEICDAVRQIQMSGVVVQTFVLCIGSETPSLSSCAGCVFPVANEEQFAKTLYDIFTLSGRKAQVVLKLVDRRGEMYETEHAVAFYDHRTGVVRQTTIYSVDGRLEADTLLMDPLVNYDITVFTRPPQEHKELHFAVGEANSVVLGIEEGGLRVNYRGPRSDWQQGNVDVVVRQAGGGKRIATQKVGAEESYVAGRYDIEIETLPPTVMQGVEVRGGAVTELTVPRAGMLTLGKPKGITTGAIFRVEKGRLEHVTDLNPSSAGERLMLQPGEYEVVLHQERATDYDAVQRRRFEIESSQTTKIQF